MSPARGSSRRIEAEVRICPRAAIASTSSLPTSTISASKSSAAFPNSARVDGVLLTSVDGRVHLAQAREIIAAGKPMFIDKPLASTLDDAREIAPLAKAAGVPCFSASTLRYKIAHLKTADISGVEVFGPGPLEEHHPMDLSVVRHS